MKLETSTSHPRLIGNNIIINHTALYGFFVRNNQPQYPQI